MLIGTDVSIKECKDSGYLIMDCDMRHKFNHQVEAKFYRYLPDYCRAESGIKGYGDPEWTRFNTSELWELYQDNKKGIQSCCDYHVEAITEVKSYYDMLDLADCINSYRGIFS
jgi:hypothetical protein